MLYIEIFSIQIAYVIEKKIIIILLFKLIEKLKYNYSSIIRGIIEKKHQKIKIKLF